MLYFITDDPESAEGRELRDQMVRNLRAFEKRVESNPWTFELRRVRAEVERTGDQSLYADFERRFLADMRKQCGPA